MRRSFAALACAAALAAACGGAGAQAEGDGAPGAAASGSEPPAASDAAPSAASPSEVPDAFAFRGSALDGSGPVVGADYAGRDVVLWMWAPW